MVQRDHGVSWSCTSLRKLLGSLRPGWPPIEKLPRLNGYWAGSNRPAPPRGAFGRRCRLDATASLSLRGGVAQEGATATVSVLDRRGKRVGTAYLGRMPESGQATLTDQLTGLLQAIFRQVDSQLLRLAYVSDEGHHPSTYYHQVLKKMVDPRRPWRPLAWDTDRRFLPCLRVRAAVSRHDFRRGRRGSELGQRDAPCAQDQGRWGGEGIKVCGGAAALSGAAGQVSSTIKPIATSKSARSGCAIRATSARTYLAGRHYGGRVQGRLYAAAQTLGNVVDDCGRASDLGPAVIGCRVWDEVHRRYLASKPLPVTCVDTAKAAQQQPLAA